ncbi:MAG: AMP-dependent synthetase [Chloroflexi bacterium]|nr:AMP-dependent synthetase [Chloroflexota bacterium]|tara:strand:- start:1186 stop:2694 length:1509 start_codon:yes stop_codon:yes gene_type:complete
MNIKILNNLIKQSYSEKIALISEDFPPLSYKEFSDEILRGSELLTARGLKIGDAVSIALDNGIEFMISFLSITNAGGIAAPLNPTYTTEEFKFYFEDSKSKFLITSKEKSQAISAAEELNIIILKTDYTQKEFNFLEKNSPLVNYKDPSIPSENDVALFLHTSGTTSRPKGVPLTHKNLMQSISNITKHYSLSTDDNTLIVMPLFHVHGLIGAALSTLSSGGKVIIPPKFSASSFWDQVKQNNVTWYSAVPTIHQILLNRADQDNAPYESFRFIRSCSAALAPIILENLERRFGAPVLEAYGMTEASHQMSSNPLPPKIRKPGTVGNPTGIEIGIMDMSDTKNILERDQIGEIVIKGENVTSGYNNKSANKESFVNGWFRTGDQGIIDKENYLTLTGRIKELINRGGEKISPLEIDAILLKHPNIIEAVSFGVPNIKYGECVQAAIVTNKDSNEEEIRKYCLEYLADFKVPEMIHITKTLPRTATGKLQRRIIGEKFGVTLD